MDWRNTSFCKLGGFSVAYFNQVEREPNQSCQLIDHYKYYIFVRFLCDFFWHIIWSEFQ